MSWSKKKAYHVGWMAELCAALFLQAKGYRLRKWRYRTPVGEIDLLLSSGSLLVVVEVKKRRSLDLAVESLSPRQQKRLLQAGKWALTKMNGTHLRVDGVFFAPWRLPLHLYNILEER